MKLLNVDYMGMFWIFFGSFIILTTWLLSRPRQNITVIIEEPKKETVPPPGYNKTVCEACEGSGIDAQAYNYNRVFECSFCGGEGYFLDPVKPLPFPDQSNERFIN